MSMSLVTSNCAALLIGLVVSAALYGIANIQVSYYYFEYPHDNITIKTLVCVVWVLETFHTVLSTFIVHHYLVANYGNPSAFAATNWPIFVSMGINVTIAFIVQSFFAYQIYYLCGRRKFRWPVMAIIIITVIGHAAFGYETVISGICHYIKKDKFMPKLGETMSFGIFSVSSDVAIAAALIFLLQNTSASSCRTRRLVDTLTVYAIHRCLLTTVVAIVETIVVAMKPESLYFLAIDFSIGKLWSNSLFATLNTRNYVREVNKNSLTLTAATPLQFSNQSVAKSSKFTLEDIIKQRPDADYRKHYAEEL